LSALTVVSLVAVLEVGWLGGCRFGCCRIGGGQIDGGRLAYYKKGWVRVMNSLHLRIFCLFLHSHYLIFFFHISFYAIAH
jgi:hypothetical protein